MSELSDKDQEDLGNTAEDIDNTLRVRDEVIGDDQGDMFNKSHMTIPFASPTLDGGTLLLSRYGIQDSGFFRMYELISTP
nr:hypothetical transcript [Hymenolepis microstoma]